MTHTCPMPARDNKHIKEHHGALMSTRDTEEFYAVGQVIHMDEPRVGENRAVDVVEQEAEDFLRELYQENFFANEVDFQERLQRARIEIRSSSVEGMIYKAQEIGVVGGTWTQTPQELEFGIRRAWRNARKCIMRSHCEDLRLCDLRSTKRSNEMAAGLVKGLTEAYNGGNIIPTAFIFPPRTPNNRGPMIWNNQLLSFAAYESEDGSVIGDPNNIQLTKDIIELGWVPTQPRSRWDVLPVVVMAEDDEPVFVELPANLRRLVKIRHPKHEAAFWKLDLKWVAFPALSRLGFDIGGVQYTATPFIGWFMDTEIGVRGLADPFRYNALPDVVKALYLDDPTLEPANAFEGLPKYEQLVMLSRAQVELNYAIYHSFLRDGIAISDPLSASKKWARYDDEFEKVNGYRLPSDPYFLAPPQGSVIPVWHRGDASNYWPKPLICWHVQDPVTIWKMQKSRQTLPDTIQSYHVQSPVEPSGLEWKSQGTTQEEPVLAAPKNTEEAGPSISDVETDLSFDRPAQEASSSFIASQDGVDSLSTSSTDILPFLNHVEPGSLTSSWDILSDLAAMPESSPSISMDDHPPSDDVKSLSGSWETLMEPAAQLELISVTSVEMSSLSSTTGSLSSHRDTSVDLVPIPDSSPLKTIDSLPLSSYVDFGSPTPKYPRSNYLSTIEEEVEREEEAEEGNEEHAEKRTYDARGDIQEAKIEGVLQEAPEAGAGNNLGAEGEGEEIRHIGTVRSGFVIQTMHTDNPDLWKGPTNVPFESKPNILPSTMTSNYDVGDLNSDDKVELENASSPSGAAAAEEAAQAYDPSLVLLRSNNQPPQLEAIVLEGGSAASEASIDRLQQYELPSVIKIIWPATDIPTLRAYAGTLRVLNPFTLEDPIRVISSVFKRMYSHLLQPYKAGIVPGRPMYTGSHGTPISPSPRNARADGFMILDAETRSSNNSRALESLPYVLTSMNTIDTRQPETSHATGVENLPPPGDGEPGSILNNWDTWELATELYLKFRTLAETLHDMILTAHPFNNFKSLLAHRNSCWPSAQAVWEVFQLMTKALHGWTRRFAGNSRWRRVTSVIRSSSMTIVDLLLVYLTQLRAKHGGP